MKLYSGEFIEHLPGSKSSLYIVSLGLGVSTYSVTVRFPSSSMLSNCNSLGAHPNLYIAFTPNLTTSIDFPHVLCIPSARWRTSKLGIWAPPFLTEHVQLVMPVDCDKADDIAASEPSRYNGLNESSNKLVDFDENAAWMDLPEQKLRTEIEEISWWI